jgi:hypothetical protein
MCNCDESVTEATELEKKKTEESFKVATYKMT